MKNEIKKSKIEIACELSYEETLKSLKKELKAYIKNARDPDYAFIDFRKKYFENYDNRKQENKDLIQLFHLIDHKLKINKNSNFYLILIDHYKENGSDLSYINYVASFKAHYDFVDFLNAYQSKEISENDVQSENQILWAKEFNQRDFIKIIYSLYSAGFLKGDITKLVPEIAKRLDFVIRAGWKSNFSKGIHYNKDGFENSKVLDDLKDAFIRYSTDLFNKKK